RGLPKEQIRRDGRAQDSANKQQLVFGPVHGWGNGLDQDRMPGQVGHDSRGYVSQQNHRQPFQQMGVLGVRQEYLQENAQQGKTYHQQAEVPARPQQLDAFGHSAQIGTDVEGVGRE